MSHTKRWLIIGIMVLLVVNIGLGIGVYVAWSTPHATSTTAPHVAVVPTSITPQCRHEVDVYMQLSAERINTYFAYYDAIPTSNSTTQLAGELKLLSKTVPPLPTNCPADLAALLNANYLSVYASAPIHLYVIITKSTNGVIENANTRVAMRFFQRELDIAESTTWRIQQALNKK